MQLVPNGRVVEKLGNFSVLGQSLSGIRVSSSPPELTNYMRNTEEGVRRSVQLEVLKDDPVLRAYRDFFWKAGIDPTKTRPASEALIRRILRGNPLPAINSFVDALNIASVETRIAFAAFDRDRLAGELELRLARLGESILPIGHAERLVLEGREMVIADGRRVIALYPHRDSEETKITEGSKRALVLSCGVPGVDHAFIQGSLGKCLATVARFCGGTPGDE